MPVKKEREYRTLVTPLTAQVASDKRINTECSDCRFKTYGTLDCRGKEQR